MEHRSAAGTRTRRPPPARYASAMRWGVGAPPRLGHPPPITRRRDWRSGPASVSTPGGENAPHAIRRPHAPRIRLVIGLDNDDLLGMLRRALG